MKILKCSCAHEFQDERYGVGFRAMNKCSPKSAAPLYRCTVCKAERLG